MQADLGRAVCLCACPSLAILLGNASFAVEAVHGGGGAVLHQQQTDEHSLGCSFVHVMFAGQTCLTPCQKQAGEKSSRSPIILAAPSAAGLMPAEVVTTSLVRTLALTWLQSVLVQLLHAVSSAKGSSAVGAAECQSQ